MISLKNFSLKKVSTLSQFSSSGIFLVVFLGCLNLTAASLETGSLSASHRHGSLTSENHTSRTQGLGHQIQVDYTPENHKCPSESNDQTNHPMCFFYDWGLGNDGWGYCYRWSNEGFVLDQGRPHPNQKCEATSPSYFDWGRGRDGWGYCYQFARGGLVLNQGRPQPHAGCERVSPSFYRWGRGHDGFIYCYQWTRSGLILNQGHPVPDLYCRQSSSRTD